MNLSLELQQFGLNAKQAQIYLALLELGNSTVIDLAKKTGIIRTTVYDVLLELEKKGLVGKTKKRTRRLFFAEEPGKIEKIIEEKKQRLSKLMPALNALVSTAGNKPVIRYYEGIEGIKEVYRDTLQFKGELLAFVTENIILKLGRDFADEYKKKRKNAQIIARVIGPDTDEIIAYKASDAKDLKETRLVPKDRFPFSIEMNIYGNRVAFMSFAEQLGLIIESSEIARNMRFLFELAWKGTGSAAEDDSYWSSI